MGIYKKIIKFLSKRYYLFLLIIVFITYGQIIKMLPWQDDNAIFFKLSHISEAAGYLGKGMLGEGPYKYTAFFYYPIYLLFGFKTEPYFILSLITYFISCLFIYLLFKEMLNKNSARIAAFIYASGYIASDGYIRLYNSVGTSLSVILICLLFYFYWRYHKNKKILFYFISLLFFFLSIEFVRYRCHYLIGIVFLFEIIFFLLRKPLVKSIMHSLIRLVPFSYVFYKYYIVNADPRSRQITVFIKDLFTGNYYKLFGFFTSLSNLVIPDTFTKFLYSFNEFIIKTTNLRIFYLGLAVIIISFYLLIKRGKKKNVLSIVVFLAILFWTVFYKSLFVNPSLVISGEEYIQLFIGGLIVISSFSIIFIFRKENRRIFIFLLLWLLINIGAYAAYNPTFTMVSINRYLAHSFLALVGILSLIFTKTLNGETSYEIVKYIIVFLGILNIFNSVKYQHWILLNRTLPVKRFYSDLLSQLNRIDKGYVLYFDIAEDSRGYFGDAFSVAQMPETTAIAWRYGIDRYDFQMFENFSQFREYVTKNNIDIEKIKTFFYSKNRLEDTTEKFNKVYFNNNYTQVYLDSLKVGSSVISDQNGFSVWKSAEITLDLNKPIIGILPLKIYLEISGRPNINIGPYPLYSNHVSYYQINNDSSEILKGFEYLNDKKEIIFKTKIETSSEWKDRITKNLNDGDYETVWQPDRVLWEKGFDYIQFNLPESREISGIVWVNGYSNETPTNYQVEYLDNLGNWNLISSYTNNIRFDVKEPRLLSFSPIYANKFRLVFTKTLNGDAPTIAEAWLINSKYKNFNVSLAEKTIAFPFNYVENIDLFNKILMYKKYIGFLRIYWLSNKTNNWQTSFDSKTNLYLDGKKHGYVIVLPVNGTDIQKLKFVLEDVPGEIKLFGFRYVHVLK